MHVTQANAVLVCGKLTLHISLPLTSVKLYNSFHPNATKKDTGIGRSKARMCLENSFSYRSYVLRIRLTSLVYQA
jgi:hypothetical protein